MGNKETAEKKREDRNFQQTNPASPTGFGGGGEFKSGLVGTNIPEFQKFKCGKRSGSTQDLRGELAEVSFPQMEERKSTMTGLVWGRD